MPVVMNWAANMLLGVATVHAVQAVADVHQGRMPWPLLWLCTLQATLLTPIATYLFRFFPHWSMFYLFDPVEHPRLENCIGLLSAAAIGGNFLAMWLGFTGARHSLISKNRLWGRTTTSLGIIILAVSVTWLSDRIAYVGDFETFWRGQAPILWASPCGWLTLSAWGAATAFVLMLRRHYRTQMLPNTNAALKMRV